MKTRKNNGHSTMMWAICDHNRLALLAVQGSMFDISWCHIQSVTSRLETSRYRDFSQFFESIGLGLENFSLEKKSRYRSRKYLVSKKSLGIGLENIWSRKKVSVSVSIKFFGLVTQCTKKAFTETRKKHVCEFSNHIPDMFTLSWENKTDVQCNRLLTSSLNVVKRICALCWLWLARSGLKDPKYKFPALPRVHANRKYSRDQRHINELFHTKSKTGNLAPWKSEGWMGVLL